MNSSLVQLTSIPRGVLFKQEADEYVGSSGHGLGAAGAE